MKKLLILFTIMALNVALQAQSLGDFQTGQSGPWSDSNTWLEYVFPGIWNNTANTPTGASTVTIRSGHTVTRTSALAVSGNLTIAPGGDLDMTGYILSGSGTMKIESDATGTGELISNGTPTMTVQRYIDPSTDTSWHQIGVPVGSATAQAVYQDHSPDVWMLKWYAYETPAQTWQFITDENESLNQLVGYMVAGDGTFTIDWNGQIKTTDVYQSLPANFLPADAYLLFGNPYTSSIQVFAAGDSLGPNFVNSIWVWDPSSSNYTSYQMGTGGTNPGIVAAGQSMFVQIIDNTTSSSFSLSAANRVFSSTDNFLKKGGNLLNWDDDYGIGTYAMFKVVDGNSKDAGFVNFGDSGTEGFEDGYDGTKKFGDADAPQMYFVQGDLELTTDYLKTLNEGEEYTVQLNLEAAVDGVHILAANLNSLPDTKVTLEDLKTGSFHDFNKEEQYSFTASPQDNPARFLVHFLYSPTGIDESIDTNSNEISIYAYNKYVYLVNMESGSIQSEIHIYDLLGREIYNSNQSLNGTSKIPVNVSNSYLIVKVISDNDVTTQKIFVQ